MATSQYDNIVLSYNTIYDNLETLPCGKAEEANLHAAIKDHISNAKVLDLACGSGHYSRRLLEWGAQSVLGVDISAGMVEEAKSRAVQSGYSIDRLSYLVGDVSSTLDLTSHDGPFDLIVGTWLLNYASNTKEMEAMFRNIHRNLKPGGLFFGLTIPPPLCDQHELDRALQEEWAEYGTSGHVKGEVADGFEVNIALGMPDAKEKAEFDNFYLRLEVFEQGAKAAGLNEALEWLPFVLPDELRKAFPHGYWNRMVLNPHFGICRVVR
jgi:SAM-dependent methyltransferase